jgi:hypothetical protein
MQKRKEGIGGWLLCFLILTCVFAPARFVYQACTVKDAAYFIGRNSLLIVILIGSIYAGVKMVRKEAKGLYFMKSCLWTLLILNILEAGNGHGTPNAIVPTLLWLGYLYRSERVKNTYGHFPAKTERAAEPTPSGR